MIENDGNNLCESNRCVRKIHFMLKGRALCGSMI